MTEPFTLGFIPWLSTAFYLALFATVWFLFCMDLKDEAWGSVHAIPISLAVVLVACEYWEIPIFLKEYIFRNPHLPQWQNHLLVLGIAVVLFVETRFEWNKLSYAALGGGIVFNGLIILGGFIWAQPGLFWMARIFGGIWFSLVVWLGAHPGPALGIIRGGHNEGVSSRRSPASSSSRYHWDA